MSTGSYKYGQIVVSAEPRGRFEEGIASGTLFPGTVIEVSATEPVMGRFTYAAAVANFGALGVVVEDTNQGKTVSDSYASGEQMRIYFPLPGDFLLMRCANASYAIGNILLIGSGGVLQISTGTTGPQPFQVYETVTAGSGPGGVLCRYSGH